MPDYPSSISRVLIASSHPLFGEGLRSLLEKHSPDRLQILGVVTSQDQAFQALAAQTPDLLIVDYDDDQLNRDDFLQQFIKGNVEIRIVLLSLKDGEEGSEAVVYDRRTMAAHQIEDWLEFSPDESSKR